jgi:hypothetical protein
MTAANNAAAAWELFMRTDLLREAVKQASNPPFGEQLQGWTMLPKVPVCL